MKAIPVLMFSSYDDLANQPYRFSLYAGCPDQDDFFKRYDCIILYNPSLVNATYGLTYIIDLFWQI